MDNVLEHYSLEVRWLHEVRPQLCSPCEVDRSTSPIKVQRQS